MLIQEKPFGLKYTHKLMVYLCIINLENIGSKCISWFTIIDYFDLNKNKLFLKFFQRAKKEK